MGLADLQPNTAQGRAAAPTAAGRSTGVALGPLLLVLLLAATVGVMAYQAPPRGLVQVGWLGDRLFLAADAGLGAEAIARGDFYADDLTPDSPTGRSRWTREHARITLPNVGAGADLDLMLLAQGWPQDVLGAAVAQPTVSVLADGVPVGELRLTRAWQPYHVRIPAAARGGGDLRIDLRSSDTFTDTLSFGGDPRPKGLRLAELRVAPVRDDLRAIYPPAWPAVLLLCANALLLFLLLTRLLRSTPAVYALTSIGTSAAAIGLAGLRIWMGAALLLGLAAQAVLLAMVWRAELLDMARALVRRYASGRGLGYGLVFAALIWFAYSLAQPLAWLGSQGGPLFIAIFPDSLLYGLFGAGLLALGLVLGREGLPHVADGIVSAIGSRRGAAIILGLFGAVWLGYEAVVVAQLPYVGHADYADNAVVARNIVAGRGWVVDYVTQFYRLYAGLTRPQETWPLLQPLWIAPFFWLFGPTAWAAKIPNLLFNLILMALVYAVGARIWDRRVGLTAAIVVLTNYLFFRLTIYATSDLAFVVFSLGAVYAMYRALGNRRREAGGGRQGVRGWLLLSGALCGLMMLQKPSGAVIVAGMGLWLIADCRLQIADWRRSGRKSAIYNLQSVIAWALVAFLILSPYIARNIVTFGRPVFSTESYDAWVLGYRGNSGDAWEEIYDVFTPELGGPGLPDRSWILRWGFDATLEKLRAQGHELREYLMPVWYGLPEGLGWLFSHNERKNIASDTGAWLALIGAIAATRFRRRLLGLLAYAYLPYMAFMITYWRTNEERYWVMLIPWLALLGAWALWSGYDRLAAIGDRRWAPLGLILAAVALSSVIGFSRPDIANKVRNEPAIWAPDLAAYAWVVQHTPPGTPLMTRIPWQANWHTDRPTLMIPNTASRDQMLALARHYGAQYMVLENQQRVKGDAGRLLAPLLRGGNQVGDLVDGFELVYASPTADFRAFVYRIPAP
jgi:4-amino-4-deoxy-L-arabinose transferase-like glycosyltransferase